MLAWLKGILTRSKPVRASRLRFVPWVRGRYDAAVTNDANRRHSGGNTQQGKQRALLVDPHVVQRMSDEKNEAL